MSLFLISKYQIFCKISKSPSSAKHMISVVPLYEESLIRERLKAERGKGFTFKGQGDLARCFGYMTSALYL